MITYIFVYIKIAYGKLTQSALVVFSVFFYFTTGSHQSQTFKFQLQEL